MTNKPLSIEERAREISDKIIDSLVGEYGDETFISSGYAAGQDLATSIEKALVQFAREEYERGKSDGKKDEG